MTAVEWLVDQLLDCKVLLPSMIEQAKQMERKQIEEAYKEGAKKRFNTMLIKRDEINKSASDYFTKNYGQ